jgi:hypothetical protein
MQKKRLKYKYYLSNLNIDLSHKFFSYVGYNKNLDIQDYNELKENIQKEKQLKKIKFDDQNQIIDDFQEKSGSKFMEEAAESQKEQNRENRELSFE